jgi:predicted AAA+ superfamily ATPase
VIRLDLLLFLDEIQACPSAFPVLGDFRELQPAQHVIAAGSLLDFALREFPSSMPVGRHRQKLDELRRAPNGYPLGDEIDVKTLEKVGQG